MPFSQPGKHVKELVKISWFSLVSAHNLRCPSFPVVTGLTGEHTLQLWRLHAATAAAAADDDGNDGNDVDDVGVPQVCMTVVTRP